MLLKREDGVISETDITIVETLANGPLHRSADWPSTDVPTVAIGLQFRWKGDRFIDTGMAVWRFSG